MEKEVLVLDPDEQQSRNLCDILTDLRLYGDFDELFG